jgi:tryptophan synthase beta subunit
MSTYNLKSHPDENGYFGEFGGSFIPPDLQKIIDGITKEYLVIRADESFKEELHNLYKHYVGRPTPIFQAKNLTKKGNIFFKREDLSHTGAHKINHCLGEALLAKKMGKTKVIAETGAGQHGVALATAAALLGLECDIYMGEVDIQKEHPNVVRMEILGANVISVSAGTKSLKDSVDAAFMAYLQDPITQFYAIGSVVGPHPFPMMVRDFQSIVGFEAKTQFEELAGKAPEHVVACVGGGSNAIGLFSGFLDNPDVKLYGVEPSGKSFKDGEHAATLTLGKPGTIHGFKCYLLQNEEGEPLPVNSVASGLNYPGVGPEHSYLKDIKRVEYVTINDEEAIKGFFELSRKEGIIPAIESSHAIAYAMKLSEEIGVNENILINLSGRGDKDIDYVAKKYGDSYGLSKKATL